MAEFKMPSLGADMEAGVLVEWHVKPGDTVNRGDVIADVETDKGVIEIEVFEAGVIDEILIEPDTKVPVGTVMAMIQAEGEPVPAGERQPSPQPSPTGRGRLASPPLATEGRIEGGPSVPPGKRVRVSPVARKLAAELGVDLNQVHGTGPNGAINKADVEQAAAAMTAKPAESPQEATPPPQTKVPPSGGLGGPTSPHPPRAEVPPSGGPGGPKPAADFQTGMRRAIAAAMARSNRDIPHYYLETRIDMSQPLAWLTAENQKRSIKDRILPAVLLIKAVALALVDVPELNGYWRDDQLQVQEAINIGFAISLRQGGLVTPAIHHADLKDWDGLMAAMRDLITRTRAGRLRSSEMTEATITLTSLGDMGVEKVYGVIYPPQVALVGFGKVIEQPWVENGMLGIRPVLTATLAGDHRASDGMRGAQFLEALNRHLQAVDSL